MVTETAPLHARIALVTGGVRGIGYGSALELARLGADIAIADIRLEAAAEEATARIQALGREVCVIEADVGRTEDCRRLVAEAAAHFGALDVLVNNAGGGLGMYEEFEAVREEDYDRVLNVNLKGAFFTAQAAVPHLRARRGARIINLASDLAYLGHASKVAYSASKGGVISMTRAMARALAPDITVNAVAPGATATERFNAEHPDQSAREAEASQIPLGRFGEPDEIARVIGFLAGPGGAYCTGQIFNVNGGVVMP